jgi:hypothetical protein
MRCKRDPKSSHLFASSSLLRCRECLPILTWRFKPACFIGLADFPERMRFSGVKAGVAEHSGICGPCGKHAARIAAFAFCSQLNRNGIAALPARPVARYCSGIRSGYRAGRDRSPSISRAVPPASRASAGSLCVRADFDPRAKPSHWPGCGPHEPARRRTSALRSVPSRRTGARAAPGRIHETEESYSLR